MRPQIAEPCLLLNRGGIDEFKIRLGNAVNVKFESKSSHFWLEYVITSMICRMPTDMHSIFLEDGVLTFLNPMSAMDKGQQAAVRDLLGSFLCPT